MSSCSSTKQSAHRLKIIFGLSGLKATELHGNLTQAQRLEVIYLGCPFLFFPCIYVDDYAIKSLFVLDAHKKLKQLCYIDPSLISNKICDAKQYLLFDENISFKLSWAFVLSKLLLAHVVIK